MLGLGDYRLRKIYQRAALLRLPFTPPAPFRSSIWWPEEGLTRLASLPRCALSGPVQEDKAAAYRALSDLVCKTDETIESLQLREIDGLTGVADEPFNHLEDWVAGHPSCRRFRILSYQDFERTISLALPHFLAGQTLNLLSADWFGRRLFWVGQQREALACAVVYARVRGLSVSLPAQITRYRLNQSGLGKLQEQYHALWMPPQVWTSSGFMHLLLENHIPYARLAKIHPDYQEVLLLPRRRGRSDALGFGLRKAGAFDAANWLASLVEPASVAA